MGRKANFLIKKSWFFFPMNLIFKAIGGIPVDRSKKTSLTEQLTEEFNKRDYFQLAITPEGTRKYTDEWKKGFYYIALAAEVPIIIVILDYKDKTVYFKDIFYPTGDIENDMPLIKAYYKNAQGKHPKLFSQS
jgi:1-acyl-sn-glycerol-3-phosphate acyltransferase